MVLHEMWEVSKLSMGSLPYEEYFLRAEELGQLKKKEPTLYEIYRELMFHFYICLDLHPSYGTTNGLKLGSIISSMLWADLLKIFKLRWKIEGLPGP